MNLILIAVISLGAIALVLAAILYVASKKFAVYEDPRIAQVGENVISRKSNNNIRCQRNIRHSFFDFTHKFQILFFCVASIHLL